MPSPLPFLAALASAAQPTGPLPTTNPNLSNPERLDRADPMTDGNTVTGLWNYAQQYSMNDNAFTTNYGPSTPGALNVTGGQTYGATCGPTSATINDSPCAAPSGLNTTTADQSNITAGPAQAAGTGTTYSDADPTYDVCSYLPSADGGDGNTPAGTLTMGGPNIGTALDAANLTWGWFEGGFDNGYVPGHGTAPRPTRSVRSHTRTWVARRSSTTSRTTSRSSTTPRRLTRCTCRPRRSA
ncbi:MAG TPA: alkaline phosphatase family protein [Streptosporangiaceae bacterium]